MGGALTVESVCDAAGHYITHLVHGKRHAEPKHTHTLRPLSQRCLYG